MDLPAKRVIWADLDGDDELDVILDCARILLNRPHPYVAGRRTYVDFTRASGFLDRTDGEPGLRRPDFLVLGDVDNDGDLDIYSGIRCEPEKWRKAPDSDDPLVGEDGKRVTAWNDHGLRSAIHLNDGNGHFRPVENSGVDLRAESLACACFIDFDLDGCLDLFVGAWYRSYGWSYDAYPDRLYRGLGDGRFVEVTEAAGLLTRDEAGHRDSSRPTYGVVAGDHDGDRYPDLFVCAYGRQWNLLWHNNGDGTFTEIGARVGFDGDGERGGKYPEGVTRDTELPFRSNGNTFDCALADFDGDGDLDAFLGEITHAWAGESADRSALLTNLGPSAQFRYQRPTATGITRFHAEERWNQGDIHVGWIDADGDGRLDLLIASGDYVDQQQLRLFRQLDGQRFRDETGSAKLDWEGCGGISVADFDGDGDPDILIGRSLTRLSKDKRQQLGPNAGVYINESGADSHWLRIRLRGAGKGACNRLGIGCRVIVEAGGRRQSAEIRAGEGHSGHQNAPQLVFGLGPSTRVDRLVVLWADSEGSTTTLTDLGVDSRLTIYQQGPQRLHRTPLRRR